MLTDKERKWVEHRKFLREHKCSYACNWCRSYHTVSNKPKCHANFRFSFSVKNKTFVCQWVAEYINDYKDAAEFEARVAMKVNTELLDISPCFQADVCVEPRLFKYNDGSSNADGCNMCRLKHARVTVEAEMEKEDADR